MSQVRAQTAAMQVHDRLRQEIVTAVLPPRAPLSEQELTARFGVSRTPIREALLKLAEEGLVDIYPQHGSFVSPIRLTDVYDAQFVRESLECSAIALAAERIDAEQSRQLSAVLDRQNAFHKVGDNDRFFDADEEMHATLMAIAGHAQVWRQVESAKAQMDRVRHLTVRRPLKRNAVLTEHQAIIDRVLQRDVVGAVEALRTHLRGVFQSVQVLVAENEAYFATDTEASPPLRGRSAGHRR
ncbi:MAG: GntR family transcriptional regulator [Ferrovibrio sp.]|uniref:GntR family transcriptional regulator n=1 Tax=Ferrovibrio sp. TaxID=1917215 RepID=UPI002616554F|nr:GntR family transcriptional regulator [Ferrovibrio sp.]MCW0233026.1 GntR family transcriptional regulator [Ferrovibrio sp.]